jgi:hypothetical protein
MPLRKQRIAERFYGRVVRISLVLFLEVTGKQGPMPPFHYKYSNNYPAHGCSMFGCAMPALGRSPFLPSTKGDDCRDEQGFAAPSITGRSLNKTGHLLEMLKFFNISSNRCNIFYVSFVLDFKM